MKRKILFTGSFWISVIFSVTSSDGQKMPGKNYVQYLPLTFPKIMTQTDASRDFHLYGNEQDSLYIDKNKDGIGDERYERLMQLCARFSPILFWNTTYSIPLDFRAIINNDVTPLLYVDIWDLTHAEPKLIKSETLNFAINDRSSYLSSNNSNSHSNGVFKEIIQNDDEELVSLLYEFDPKLTRSAEKHPNGTTFKVLYFDLPGEDEKSWKPAYKNIISGNIKNNLKKHSRLYAHPFIHEVYLNKERKKGYEFVIQYWFFYPFNDGGNNHEGDWEHINVRITTKERKGDLLTDKDIERIIDHNNSMDLDSLIMKKVDYYFHNFVMTLDYVNPDAYLPKGPWEATINNTEHARIGEKSKWEQILKRVWADDFSMNSLHTHPVAYIGGDNKGIDQLIALPGGKNRDSHGTYPFPGIYKGIGPIGATEEINGELDYLDAMRDSTKFLTYSPERIEIVPDWERIQDLVLNDPEARREWSWLMLPIRWGFPASKSPAAGIVKYTDTGNLAPVGPAYNTAWNRVGECEGYHLYEPHQFSSEFPLSWQDNFKNDWGFLNLTLPTVIALPPFNFFWMVPLSPLRAFLEKKNPIYYSTETVPFRRVAINLGYYPFVGDDDFARLLPKEDNEQIRKYIADKNLAIDSSTLKNVNTFTYKNIGFQLNYHVGRHFAAENLLRYSLSRVKYNLINSVTEDSLSIVQGDLQLIEYAGSLRHSFLADTFQPYVKVGYGYSTYRVKNINIGGTSVELPKTQWFHNPTFWPPWPPKNWLPNTYHVGIGFELLLNKNFSESKFWPPFLLWKWKYGTPDVGIKFEYGLYYHKLGDDAPANAGILRQQLNFALTISF
jgi:hypothetical protein